MIYSWCLMGLTLCSVRLLHWTVNIRLYMMCNICNSLISCIFDRHHQLEPKFLCVLHTWPINLILINHKYCPEIQTRCSQNCETSNSILIHTHSFDFIISVLTKIYFLLSSESILLNYSTYCIFLMLPSGSQPCIVILATKRTNKNKLPVHYMIFF